MDSMYPHKPGFLMESKGLPHALFLSWMKETHVSSWSGLPSLSLPDAMCFI